MIRRFSLASLVLAVLAAGCSQPPRQDIAADKAKLQSDALAWFNAFAKGDSEAVANMYAEDAVVMPPGMPAVNGRAAIKSFMGRMAAEVQAAKLSLKHGETTGSDVSGDVGWISGTYSVVDSAGTTVDSGSYLSAHRRTNGTWLYVRDTWISDRPPAPPQQAHRKPSKM